MKKESGMYQNLKQCKTFKEISSLIPEETYNQTTIMMLLYWCLVPIFSMTYSYITRTDADLLIYLSVLGMGMIGVYLTLLRFWKSDFERNMRGATYLKSKISQIAMLLMLVWSLFASFHARNKYYAFIGESYSHEGFLTFVAYAGFFGSSLFLTKKNLYEKYMIVFCAVATVLSSLTILQYMGVEIRSFSGYMKLSATFHNTNHFGYYLTLAAICVAGLFLISVKKFHRIIFLVQFVIIFSALVFNNTFGSFLGVLGGLFITIIIFCYCNGAFKFKYMIPLIFAIVVALILNLSTAIVGNNIEVLKKDTIEIINDTEKSSKAGSGRWELWVNAVKFIQEEPLFGYGPDNLEYNYAKVGINMLKPHNEYLQFAACLGIPALICYIVAVGNIYIQAFKNRRQLDPLIIVSLCVISGYFISAFVGNTKFYVTPYFMIFLALTTKVTLEE